MLVVRAMPSDWAAALDQIVEDAQFSAGLYVVEMGKEGLELLYGISVFAHRHQQELTDVLYRFPSAPMFVEASVAVLRASGFAVLPTGTDPDHFDVQLIGGVSEAQAARSESDIRAAATRLLDAAGEMQPNPSYAGSVGDPPEED